MLFLCTFQVAPFIYTSFLWFYYSTHIRASQEKKLCFLEKSSFILSRSQLVTVITCIIIGLGFYIAREARDTASAGSGQINRLNAEFMESDKIMYDGIDVSGSEVLNVINKFKNDELCIQVDTKKGGLASYIYADTTLTARSKHSIKEAQELKGIYYVNPNALFQGNVLRDDNNVIVGLLFKQI